MVALEDCFSADWIVDGAKNKRRYINCRRSQMYYMHLLFKTVEKGGGIIEVLSTSGGELP